MLQTSTCKKSGISVIRSLSMNENGAVLVISLVFLVLLTMLGTTAVVLTTTDMKIGANYKDSELAFNNAQAGVQYAIGKMEEGLKVWTGGAPGFTLPTTSPTASPASPLLSSSTFATPSVFAPSGSGFTLSDITELSTDPDIYEFTSTGTTLQGSTVNITVRVELLPGIMFGAFGDNKLEMKNTAGVYSYSHSDCSVLDSTGLPECLPPTPADTTGEADVGSNNSVILNMGDIVDGDTASGETPVGIDGSYIDHGATITGSANVDMPRIDPDPLGIDGGALGTELTYYSNPANYDNGDAIEGDAYYTPSSYTVGIGTTINLNGTETLTLKGAIDGGANFYFTDINLKSNSVLFIDTTPHLDLVTNVLEPRSVNIYLTGAMNVANGAEVVNLEKYNVTTPPYTSPKGCDAHRSSSPTGPGACECADTGPPSFDASPCMDGLNKTGVLVYPQYMYKIGEPSNFSIFSNSTSGISIGNGVGINFAGLIYAPFAQIRFDNAVTIYGAIWGKDVELVTNTKVYFDTDIKDKYDSGDLKIISWRDNRM